MYANWHEMMSPEQGIIIAWNNQSPEIAPPSNIPRRLSDVLFLVWQELCRQKNADPSKLRAIVRVNIINGETIDIIDHALDVAGDSQIEHWPGNEILVTDTSGQAILGTPNGYGAAYMLIDHQKLLEFKLIHSVTAFLSDQNGYCLMFNM